MIKTVLFDVGGVILDMKPLMEHFINIFHPDKKEDLWNKLNIKSARLCRGEINGLEFWQAVAKKLNRDIPVDILEDLWIKDYEKYTDINKDTLAIIKSLCGKYKLGIVSNTIEPHTLANRRRKIFDFFDEVILSYEVKMTKENPDIFRLAAEKLKSFPEECVFIDDIAEFTETAKSVGMESICFKDPVQLKKDLASIGVVV